MVTAFTLSFQTTIKTALLYDILPNENDLDLQSQCSISGARLCFECKDASRDGTNRKLTNFIIASSIKPPVAAFHPVQRWHGFRPYSCWPT